MAISRPLLLALLGAVLLGATFFAVQNARDTSSDDSAPAAQSSAPAEQAAAPAEPAPAASPEDTLKAAFDLDKVDSAAFDTKISMSTAAQRLGIDLSGAFETGAANDVPEFAFKAEAAFAGRRMEGGFVSLGDEAYFTRGETGWRVPDEVWNPVVQTFAGGAAQRLEQLSLGTDPQSWVRDVRSEGTETLDGVETTHVSAAVDPESVAKDLVALARQSRPDVASTRDIARTVERVKLDAWVGSDDRVLRRVLAEVVFAPPPELRGPNDAARSEISLDLRLTGVNEPQTIEAPADVRQGMPSGAFGQLAEGLVSGLSGVTGGDSVSLAALTSPNPRRAARAVADGKKVVLFFHNPDGLDDRAMQPVVRALDARTKAVVLSDDVDAVDRYGKMVEDLGVSQTPAVVLIDRTGQARLIEGFVDTDTLAQAVADAR